MNTQEIVIYLVVLVVTVAEAAFVGYVFGNLRGRDAQWVDDYLERARKERERRDRYGRFTVKQEAKP